MSIRTVLADDEALARDRLRFLLEADRRVQIVAECRNGREVTGALEQFQPDLLFLDVEMPGRSGVDIASQISDVNLPFIVFVTAYPQHATKAFDIGAVDYIVKPIDTDRLHLAIDRVERNIRQGDASLTQQELRSAIELLKQALPRSTYQTRFLVPNGARHTFVDVNEIDWVEAADYYACIHVGRSEFLLRETIAQLSQTLDPSLFVRVHRSAIVNVRRVKEMVREGRSEMFAILSSGQRIKLSKTGWDDLSSVAGGNSTVSKSR